MPKYRQVSTYNKHYYRIADKIRSKLGVTTKYKPDEMEAAIDSIPGGQPQPPTPEISYVCIATINDVPNIDVDVNFTPDVLQYVCTAEIGE